MNRKRKGDARDASFLLTKTTEQLEKAPPGAFPLQSARMREFNLLLAELESALTDEVAYEVGYGGSGETARTSEARFQIRRFVRTIK